MIKFAEKFQLFSNAEIGSVRMLLDQDGNPWFVAIDVCNILEIANSRDAMTRLDEYEKSAVGLTDAGKTLTDAGFDITRVRTVNLVNESGLYSLILGSRKPSAKPFKRWLTRDVIPSIRKNGGYIWGQEDLQKEDLAILTPEIQKLQAQVSKLKKRWHELVSENNKLKDIKQKLNVENRHLKKESDARGKEIDDLWNLWDSTQRDFESEAEKRNKAELKIKSNAAFDAKPLRTRIVYVSADGFVLGEKFEA